VSVFYFVELVQRSPCAPCLPFVVTVVREATASVSSGSISARPLYSTFHIFYFGIPRYFVPPWRSCQKLTFLHLLSHTACHEYFSTGWKSHAETLYLNFILHISQDFFTNFFGPTNFSFRRPVVCPLSMFNILILKHSHRLTISYFVLFQLLQIDRNELQGQTIKGVWFRTSR
jgi:hypothetical protein